MSEAAASPLARGLRWLRSVPTTISLCLLFAFVFAVEWYVWTRLGRATFVEFFVATREPSVGWVLAPLAHLPTDGRHLTSSVAQLLLFGGIVERRFGRRQFLALVVGSGIATTAAQVASYAVVGVGRPVGTLGASGIVLAMTALAVVDSLRYRRATGDWHGDATWVWVLLGGFVVVQAVFGLANLASGTASVGVVGHLTGVIIGSGLGLIRPVEGVVRSDSG
ncbi:rhomboid family intramembrane serine protease [Halosimplex sp. J119]